MNNVQGTSGSTSTPNLGGGLTSRTVLGDPATAPEPTTVLLFGAGLLALGYLRKRNATR